MLFSDLKREQKEAIGLLQIGTFLEYFDLMIYVHMAVLLNELFFPPTDPKTAAILTAFAFCSTYLLRPFGALIFGYIGDNFGRKPTVIITTTIMACCCVLMANLPTYAEIGITAAVIVSVLRIMQGMSSMGERMGAQIYVTELLLPPVQYPAVNSIGLSATLGVMAALGVATLATRVGFDWRLAFWLGAIIAIVGMVARTRLRETPEYANAKIKMRRALGRSKEEGLEGPAKLLESLNKIPKEKIGKGNFLSFVSLYCSGPFVFYIAYIYFLPVLKSECGYSTADLILHNFLLSIVDVFWCFSYTALSHRFYPLFLDKITGVTFILLVLIAPIGLSLHFSHYSIFLFQALLLWCSAIGTASIFIKHFPIFKRFTASTFGYALARAVMYIIISFGLVYLTEWFGFYGIWFIATPLIFFWFRALFHFERLEKKTGEFPQAYPFNLSKKQRKERLSV